MNKMAFRRKDVKKASYYVWFLGARESAGLRGEQFILPALSQLLRQERLREPVKVTLQVSSKGMKIVQNVCRARESKPAQVKHVIPSTSITCALQSEDVVSVVLLLFNPLTGCPVHVHAYRCDSLATAFGLRSQLQTLIDRPENQRKFAEIEARLAAKGLVSEKMAGKHLRDSSLKANDKPNSAQFSHATGSLPSMNSIATANVQHRHLVVDKNRVVTNLPLNRRISTRNNQHTLNSDGRSAGEDDTSEDASGSNGSSERDGRSPVDPMVAIMYESLAAELKAKLGNPEVAPILLPPRDYDTVCRSKGQVFERTDRKCTNHLLVGGPTKLETNKTKSKHIAENTSNKCTLEVINNKTNIAKNTSSSPIILNDTPSSAQTSPKTNKTVTSGQASETAKPKEPVKPPRNRGSAALAQQEAGCEEIIQKTDQIRKVVDQSHIHKAMPANVTQSKESNVKTAPDQPDSCTQAQVHSQVRLQKLREEKAKVAAKLEQLEQMEQLERATAESARKHAINQLNRTASNVDLIQQANSKPVKTGKTKSNDDKSTEQLNPKLITQHGLKQIGSSLANKIRQTLFVSSNSNNNDSTGKQSPQLIRHQMLHSSQPDLRSPIDLPPKSMKTQTLEAPIVSNLNSKKPQALILTDGKCLPPLESIQTLDGKQSSASSGKSASSGIGSSRLAIHGFEDEFGFGSTDEELELEMLRREDSRTAGSGSSGAEPSAVKANGDWRSRRAAVVRSMSNLTTGNTHDARLLSSTLDEGLNEEEDEYFINDELELDERPLAVVRRHANASSDEEHPSTICYDDNLMPRIERPARSTCRRATSVESVVRSTAQAVPKDVLPIKSKRSVAKDLDEIELLHHVESLPPVSRQACLRRSETSVTNSQPSNATSANVAIKRGQSTTQLQSIPSQSVQTSNSNGRSIAITSKRYSSDFAHHAESSNYAERSSFFYPHVPNELSPARRHFREQLQRAHPSLSTQMDLKRQASIPSLLHPLGVSSASSASPIVHKPKHAFNAPYAAFTSGPRSAVSNSQLHLLSAQPFRLRSKPLHGFVNGF